MNIGDYSGDDANTIGSFALYFDIINTTTYDWFVSDVSLSSTLQSQNVSVTYSGDIDAGLSTEITDTTPLSGTIILTISSPNATSIDLSGITVTLEAIVPPTPASSFTFSYNDADHTASITNFVGSETEVVIPSTVEYNGTTYKVTAIADGSFSTGAFSNSNITSIIIPDSVTSIGSYAFYNCYSLTSITIPEGVTSIGNGAYSGCNALAEVYNYSSLTIPQGTSDSSVGYLGEYAKVVYNASDLTDVKPETRITVVDNVQYYDYGDDFIALAPAVARRTLTEVTLDNRTTEINQYAFYQCSSLTSFTIPENVTTISYHAFQYCTSLTSITIPEGVTSIGNYAFYQCSSLTSITIPSSVTSIGIYAFSVCHFSEVTIDSSYAYQRAGDTSSACGYLLEDANTVYVNANLVGSYTASSYLTSNFTCSDAPNEDGYYVYTRNA